MPPIQPGNAIGGYFELALGGKTKVPAANRMLLQSARAAFHLLLECGRPSRVFAPSYICDEMLSPLASLGIALAPYSLDDRLMPAGEIELAENEWLLYPNYFGAFGNNEEQILARFPPSQVILDRAQALFAPPRNCLASIYSPRKFFGLPDGGVLESSLPVRMPTTSDPDSLARSRHLLERLGGQPEDGYADFLAAEASLADTRPLRMSRMTTKIWSQVDLSAAQDRRNRNFACLQERLGEFNGLGLCRQQHGPLCYPLLIDVQGLRERLIENRIFVARYWPGVAARVSPESFEYRLMACCLPIPCDQRYDEDDMEAVAGMIRRYLVDAMVRG